MEALAACRIGTRFRGVVAFAPFRLECIHCRAELTVRPPDGVILDRDPLDQTTLSD
jgi:hypothetical protein